MWERAITRACEDQLSAPCWNPLRIAVSDPHLQDWFRYYVKTIAPCFAAFAIFAFAAGKNRGVAHAVCVGGVVVAWLALVIAGVYGARQHVLPLLRKRGPRR
jgi:hypothetical protein